MAKSFDKSWKEHFWEPLHWWDNRKSKASSAHPDFKYKASKEFLWIFSCDNLSSVAGEPGAKVFSFRTHAQKVSLCAVYGNAIHDEAAAFVASLRACAKKKDLHTGSRLHDDVLKRGLLEKCLDALVTMYAKCGALAKAKELLYKHKCRDLFSWTDLIAGYAHNGQGQDALDCFENMQREGLSPDAVTFCCILKACSALHALDKGEQVHDEIARRGLMGNNIVLANALVDMYVKCGALAKAQRVVEELPVRDVITWSTLIAGYAQQGQGEQALICFERMQCEGLSPDAVTFGCILKACGSIRAADIGEQIHDEIVRNGLLQEDAVLGSTLVDMYAKCGALLKAQQVLEELPVRDVVSWSALITGYSQQGRGEQALICFEEMLNEGFSPNAVTFLSILKACGSIKAAEKGEQIHQEISRLGLLRDNVVLGTALVDMYAKCGALTQARCALEELSVQDVIAWNALITGYVEQGQAEQALNCFEMMKQKCVSSNSVTFLCILRACGSARAVDMGEQIHGEIARLGLIGKDIVLGNALVDMYAKFSALVRAQEVLEELPVRDIVSWNSLIAGYAQNGQGEQALKCFDCMQCEGLPPNEVTFLCILKACGCLGVAEAGEQVHDVISRRGLLGNNVLLASALVDMYAKCGAFKKAEQILMKLPFRNAILWTALISGYTEQGLAEHALICFEQMEREGFLPDTVTYLCILKACASMGSTAKGEHIHDKLARQGLLRNNMVLGNALVDMYVKCGAVTKARTVFEELPARNVVSWSALIAGYAQQGQGEQALDCFEQMQREGLCPDNVTLLCILKACGSMGATDKGEQIHDVISRQGLLRKDGVLGNALVDMYAKCGALSKAQRVLEELPSQDFVSWNALLTGYAQHGQGKQALNCFELMQRKGIPPDAVTFLCVLKACGSMGLVDDAHKILLNMNSMYGIKPDYKHSTCMVDVFGRAGHLNKAIEVLQEMQPPDYSIELWSSLLGACGKWGDVNVGRWAFERAVQTDKSDPAAYILMANIYAAAGMQEHAETIDAMRKQNKAWKKKQQLRV